MLGIHDYWLFVLSGIMLNLAPGQDSLYIAGRSIAEGRNAGIAAALGVGTGCLVHVTAAALGLSAILAISPLAFQGVKWLGGAYLVYLGARLVVSRKEHGVSTVSETAGGWSTAYRRGILSNALNPKVALFFLAFLPQFVDADSPHRALSFLILGGTFVFTGTVWCLTLAVAAARASEGIRRSPAGGMLVQRIAGVLFIGLGIKLVLSGM